MERSEVRFGSTASAFSPLTTRRYSAPPSQVDQIARTAGEALIPSQVKPPALAEPESPELHGTITTLKEAMELFKDVPLGDDIVGYLARLIQIVGASKNPFVHKAFQQLAESISVIIQGLPGIPHGAPFDYLHASVTVISIETVEKFVHEQADSVLSRCLVACEILTLPRRFRPHTNYGIPQIAQALELVYSWTCKLPKFSMERYTTSLLSIYWELREEPPLRDKFSGFKDFDEFEHSLNDSTPETIFRFLSESAGVPPLDTPAIACLEHLPVPAFSYFGCGTDLPWYFEEIHLWSLIRTLLSREDLENQPFVIRACLLFLVPNCSSSLFEVGDIPTYSFHRLSINRALEPVFNRLYPIITQLIHGSAETTSLDLREYGTTLALHRSNSSVVIMALLLIVVESLEQGPAITDPTDLQNLLTLLGEICPFFHQIPLPIRSRTTQTLTSCLLSANQMFKQLAPMEWPRFRALRKFNPEQLGPDFHKHFDTCNEFQYCNMPLMAITKALSTPVTRETSVILIANFKKLDVYSRKSLFQNETLLSILHFNFDDSDSPEGDELLNDDEFREVSELFYDVARIQEALANETFVTILLDSATKLLEDQFTET